MGKKKEGKIIRGAIQKERGGRRCKKKGKRGVGWDRGPLLFGNRKRGKERPKY